MAALIVLKNYLRGENYVRRTLREREFRFLLLSILSTRVNKEEKNDLKPLWFFSLAGIRVCNTF